MMEVMSMTPEEFRKWFDGFCAGLDGKPPTVEQWEQVKQAVLQLRSDPTDAVSSQWISKINPFQFNGPQGHLS